MNRAFTLVEVAVVITIIALLAAIAVPNFIEAEQRADVAGVKEDQKRVAIALATYKLDYANYPFHYPFTATAGYIAPPDVSENINAASARAAGQYVGDYNSVASFATAQSGDRALGLTTPVAYLPRYVADKFSPTYNYVATFSFAACPKEFLLWSQGSDGENQLDSPRSSFNSAEHIVRDGQSLPSPYLIAGPMSYKAPLGAHTSGHSFTYDPTNGTGSTGDIWRVANGAS